MLLGQLLDPGVAAAASAEAIEVGGLTADSRLVRPGDVFAALSGAKADGARFIADAVARGAVAVIAAQSVPAGADLGIPLVRVPDPRQALAHMAARFYGAQPETAVAVTGTSGKTSVAEFTRQIFDRLGYAAASLGTIGVVKPGGAVYGSLTTPDPISLHRTLAALAAEGITHLAFEASSHGLDQRRLDGVKLTAAAFTNLGRDHMDYHASEEDYLAAKARLFTELLEPGQPAVVNTDGARSREVYRMCVERGLAVATVGRHGHSIRLTGLQRDGFRQRLDIACVGKTWNIQLPLVGAYQVENALVAAGLAIAAGNAAGDVLGALEALRGVPGRLDIVGEVRGGLCVVDYAHKPEALAAALAAVRPFATARLICVFGCGGDRDRGKRPLMGRIAVEAADDVIVTDDNPRSEKPEAIRAEILAAAPGAREIGDRAEAIRAAVAMLGPGDVLIVAGKGHETGQIVGGKVLPFSDHDVIRGAIAEVTA
jgi:UDP-N-acetylmuramoyl-L-alanyl-D-glutamate--2,6-diaminopimelate ligase